MKNDPSTPGRSNPPHDWEALARYLSGESSAAESERIARWLAEHPADAELLAALDNAMGRLALRDASDVDVEAALRNVAARRDAPPTPVRTPSRSLSPKRSFPRPTAWPQRTVIILAAAAVIILAARALLQRKDGANRLPSADSVGTSRTFATATGKRDSLRLPDGGRVILGPASQLIVAAGYGKDQHVREVELHGEAYFDVVHDTTHPFVVHAGVATIRDVGTSFGVRNVSASAVHVVVTSGSVALSSKFKTGANVIDAGDAAVIRPDGSVIEQHGASPQQYLAWMRDSLVFRNTPISEVSSDLSRWYGVVLHVEDSALARQHLTMTFAGDPLDRVLRVIGLGLGADVERRGDTAFVRPRTRTARPQ